MDPAVAACRSAVRRVVATVPPGGLLLAACSGGADSLALAAALLVEAPRAGRRVGVVTVDHGLQPGSAEQAAAVARWAAERGADPVRLLTVQVGRAGGPEAAARTARYAALDTAVAESGAALVLLGHTRDDQAETVLLGLARGSGGRSLAGMAAVSGRFARPLLELDRVTTAAACAAEGLLVWADPQNEDPRYARVRIRTDALPALEAAAGPGVSAALARTARLLRDDADALDGWAAQVCTRAQREDAALDVAVLAAVPAAVRTRVLRTAAVDAGCPPGATTRAHVDALDALVTRWRGQGAVALPAGVGGVRRCGWLLFIPPDPSAAPEAGARTCHDRPVPGTSSRS